MSTGELAVLYRENPYLNPVNEIANWSTHGFGFLLSIYMMVMLIRDPAVSASARKFWGNLVFGSTLIILYATSTAFHGVTNPVVKEYLRYADHIGIFLLIAGTYTPITMGPLWESSGLWILVIVWCIALIGILGKIFFFEWFLQFSTTYFIGMASLIVVASRDLLTNLSSTALWWLAGGGASYVIGCHFFSKGHSSPAHHAVWHVFVLIGSTSHALLILKYL
jgi:hemolysin III